MPDIDCFANRINTQLSKYISYRPDPNAYHVDAFSVSWKHFRCYLFPPFILIGRVLQKVQMENIVAMIVVPDWPSQTWYTTLTNMLVQKPMIIQPSQNALILPNCPNEVHVLWKKLKLMICLVSGKPK